MSSPTTPASPPPQTLTATPLRRRVARGGAWSIAGTGLMFVASFVANVVLARWLPPGQLGAYYLSVSLITTAAIVGRLGLDRAVVRFAAAAEAVGDVRRMKLEIRQSLLLTALGSLALGVIIASPVGRLLSVHVFGSATMARYLPVLAAWAVVESFRLTASESFRGVHDVKRATLYGSPLQTVLATVFVVVAALQITHGTARQASLLTGLSSLCAGVAASVLLVRRLRRMDSGRSVTRRAVTVSWLTVCLGWISDRLARYAAGMHGAMRPGPRAGRSAGAALSVGLPIMVLLFVSKALAQGDLWVVGALRSPHDVALYGAALRLAVLLQIPTFVLSLAIYPVITELYVKGQHARLERLLRGTASLATLPMAVVFVVLAVAGRPIMGVMFGSFFRSAAPAMILLSFGQLVSSYTSASGALLVNTGHERIVMWSTLAAGVIAIGGEIAVARSLGLVGVAAFSGGGTALQSLLTLYFARRRLKISTHASFSPRLLTDTRQLVGELVGR